MSKFKLALLLAAMVAAGPAMASPQLATQGGCTICHTADKTMVGPSWQAIAAKYKGQSKAAALLAERVRKGGVNVWGKLPMPPTPASKLNDADLKLLISWVLKTP
jgi:cytochrome c